MSVRLGVLLAVLIALIPKPGSAQVKNERFHDSALPSPQLVITLDEENGSKAAVNGALIGAVLGGLAGFFVWQASDMDYPGDCWFCRVEVVGYVGLGSFFGAVFGAFVGDIAWGHEAERDRASDNKRFAPASAAAPE